MEQDASSSIQEMKTSLKMPTLLLEVCLSPGLSPGSVKEVCPRFAKGTCVMGEKCIYQHPGLADVDWTWILDPGPWII